MTTIRLSNLILNRLRQVGCSHVFGVPGDYCLSILNDVVAHEDIQLIQCLNELNLAYAAEAYARVNGFSCIIVTGGVGELSALNGIGAANAEQLPMLVIVGTFPTDALKHGTRFHHMSSPTDLKKSMRVTQEVVEKSYLVENLKNVVNEIDQLISYAINHHCPVALHIPSDLQAALVPLPCTRNQLLYAQNTPQRGLRLSPPLDDAREAEVKNMASYILERIVKARRVLLVIGDQVVTLGLQQLLHKLVDKLGCHVMHSNRLSGVFTADHPAFVNQQIIDPNVHDLVIAVGLELGDFNAPMFRLTEPDVTLNLRGIAAEDWFVGDIYFPQVLNLLVSNDRIDRSGTPVERLMVQTANTLETAAIDQNAPINVKVLGEWVAKNGSDDDVMVWDIGSVVNDLLKIPSCIQRKYFMQEAYASIGWALPATLGIMYGIISVDKSLLKKAVQCWIGDGAFLMTAQDLISLHSYALKEKVSVQVMLLDNSGYLIERIICDNDAYNDLPKANYEGMAQFSRCFYKPVKCLRDFIDATAEPRNGVTLIHIILDTYDMLSPQASISFGAAIAASNGISCPMHLSLKNKL